MENHFKSLAIGGGIWTQGLSKQIKYQYYVHSLSTSHAVIKYAELKISLKKILLLKDMESGYCITKCDAGSPTICYLSTTTEHIISGTQLWGMCYHCI